MNTETRDYRDSTLIYYGPHPCAACGSMIVKIGHEFGHAEFDQPDEPIYPNTQWHAHVCERKQDSARAEN